MRFRERAVVSRQKPTGVTLAYPLCGSWDCDDPEDWSMIGPEDLDYPAVNMERRIAYYHEPRKGWLDRLRTERRKRSWGDPLWWGRPPVDNTHLAR